MKFYLTLINSEYVSYPPTIVKCDSRRDAKIKTLEYWNNKVLKFSNISTYCIDNNMFIGNECVVEIPNC